MGGRWGRHVCKAQRKKSQQLCVQCQREEKELVSFTCFFVTSCPSFVTKEGFEVAYLHDFQ